jgi:hypothetical protein
MVDVQTIGLALQTVSVMSVATAAVVGVRSYINSNKRAEEAKKKEQETRDRELETRQSQLFMQIYMRYLEPDLFSDNLIKLFKRSWKNAEDYDKKYDGNPDGANLDMVMAFWEGVAVLINRGMMDIGLVYELMPTNVTALWGRYGPLIREKRVSGAPPRLYSLVEDLSGKLAEYARLRGDQVVTDYSARSLRPSGDSMV